jgi:tetratricopeptide (TPR) repeat protein
MAAQGERIGGDSSVYDAITPPVSASLKASADALHESIPSGPTPDLEGLAELLKEKVADTGYLDVVNKLALVHLASGRPQEAIPLLERCVEENNSFVEAWISLAFTRAQLGHMQEAEVIFPQVLKNRASNPELHNICGLFYATYGNYTEAIIEYQRALALDPGSDLVNNNMALACSAVGRMREAQSHFLVARSLRPLYHKLGIIRDGKLQPEAAGLFRVRAQGNPLRSVAYYEAGYYHAALGERETALQALGQALLPEPDFARYYTALGFLEMNWGERHEAVDHLKRALTIDPGAYEACVHLGFYYGEEEMMDRVLEYFRLAVHLRPYYADQQFNLGEALVAMESYDEAIDCFRRAVRINPYYAMALFKLGYAYLENGQPDMAADAFTRLKAFDPNFPGLDEFLDQVKDRPQFSETEE